MAGRLTDLLTRAAKGDAEACDALLVELYPDVQQRVHEALARDFRPKNQWILPLFSTSDIVQDVFLGIVRGIGGFADQDEEHLRAWITTQVKNRILDRLRFHQAGKRDARKEAKPRDDKGRTILPGTDQTPSLCAALEERAELFNQALGTLSERERELWQLRFEQGASFADVAAALDYKNEESGRAAFRALRAKLVVRLRRLGIGVDLRSGAE